MLQLLLPPEHAARLLLEAFLRVQGGKGSGNFGHEGRPGEIGGSAAELTNVKTTFPKRFHVRIESDQGFITLLRTDDFEGPMGQQVLVGDIEVKPQYRKQGFALALYESALEYAVSVGAKNVTSTGALSQDAKDLWKRFEKYGRASVNEEGDRVFLPLKTLGGPGSGNFGHAGRPGQVGGSSDSGGGVAVGLESDPYKHYPNAPDTRKLEFDTDAIGETLFNSGALDEEGFLSLYHVTGSDPDQIFKEGLIPGKESAPGQDWEADHAKYATYFFRSKEHALDQAEQAGEGFSVIRAQLPVTEQVLRRLVPDEDTGLTPMQGVQALLAGENVGVIGGVPAYALQRISTPKRKDRVLETLKFNENQARDSKGRWTGGGDTAVKADQHEAIREKGLVRLRKDPEAAYGRVSDLFKHARPVDRKTGTSDPLPPEVASVMHGGSNLVKYKKTELLDPNAKNILAVQAGASSFQVEELIKVWPKWRASKPPTVVRVGKTDYITDGHHRLAAAKFLGVKIPVSVFVAKDTNRALGGKGSGNFGHEGRPGQVGGSGDSGTPEEKIDRLPLVSPDDKDSVRNPLLHPDVEATNDEDDEGAFEYVAEHFPDAADILTTAKKTDTGPVSVVNIEDVVTQQSTLSKAVLRKYVKENKLGPKGLAVKVGKKYILVDGNHRVVAAALRGSSVVGLHIIGKVKRFLEADEEDRALGGPGSGNFGHEGRPGKIGGSASTYHHGTSKERVQSILKNGLQTGHGAIHSVSNKKLVYVTDDIDEAEEYAFMAARKDTKGRDVAIITIRVPEDEQHKVAKDPAHSDAYTLETVPPHWIVGAKIRVAGTGKWTEVTAQSEPAKPQSVSTEWKLPSAEERRKARKERQRLRGLATPDVFFVVVILDDELKTAGGPGSGHHDHAGRPGEVGGSASGDAASVADVLTGKKVSGPQGSNPGGAYITKDGSKWYAKTYRDSDQAFGEHAANSLYRQLGVGAPRSTVGEHNGKIVYASRWLDSNEGTLAEVGLNKQNANSVLDGFVADAFTGNWDAVGTGLDNVVVFSDGSVSRIDNGGTFLHRAMGSLKTEAALEGVTEWQTLSNSQYAPYYSRVFKAAGLKGADDLGERAIKQIDKVIDVREKHGGWRAFLDDAIPTAPKAYREKLGRVLESRTKSLEQIRARLAVNLKTAGGPGSGFYDHKGRPGKKGGSQKDDSPGHSFGGTEEFTVTIKKKAPKAPPVPLDAKKQAYDEVKKGGSFKLTAAKYGMTQGQLAGYVWKTDQKKTALVETLTPPEPIVEPQIVIPTPPWEESAPAPDVSVVAPEPPPFEEVTKPFANFADAASVAEKNNFQWGKSEEGDAYAWFNEDGIQISEDGLAGDKEKTAKTITMSTEEAADLLYPDPSLGITIPSSKTVIPFADVPYPAMDAVEQGFSFKTEPQSSDDPPMTTWYDKQGNVVSSGFGVAATAKLITVPEGHEQLPTPEKQDAPAPKSISEMSIEEKKASAYAEVKGGSKFKDTAAKYGMTQGQLSGYVWKTDQKLKKEGTAAQTPTTISQEAKTVTPPALPKTSAQEPAVEPKSPSLAGKSWTALNAEQKLEIAAQEKYVWKEKTHGPKSGQYAWFDATGTQVSAPYPEKGQHREGLDTINYGKGIEIFTGGESIEGWPIGASTVRHMGSKYPTVVKDHFQPWLDNLPKTESHTITSYTGSTYNSVNDALRDKTSGSYYDQGLRIMSALKKAPGPPPPELVWRGVNAPTVKKMFDTLGNGDEVQLGGIQSASIKPSFAYHWGGANLFLEIKPKRGGFVDPISLHKNSEWEYLLPHNSTYRIRGINKIKLAGVSHPVKVFQLEEL